MNALVSENNHPFGMESPIPVSPNVGANNNNDVVQFLV
jgi:hypothetical protein